MDPLSAFALAINLAALLAALFTYLYCRRVGLTRTAAAAAGWTFACAGFFASRVMAGHLTLLEAYPSLPLLLWLAEVSLQSAGQGWRFRLMLLAVGLASCCVILAGHPQLPTYALFTTIVYIVYRIRTKTALEIISAMVLGIGVAGFALWPMWELIRRSAFLFPWHDGWAPPVKRFPMKLFTWILPTTSGIRSATWAGSL